MRYLRTSNCQAICQLGNLDAGCNRSLLCYVTEQRSKDTVDVMSDHVASPASVQSRGAAVAPPDPAASVPRSVMVAFKVLEAVGDLQPVGVSELARHLGLAKSTVQRALLGLDGLSYVYRTGEPARWSLTLRSFHLGSLASALSLLDIALPEMRHLLAMTQEAIHLNVLEGRDVVVIEKLDSMQAVRSYSERGEYAPAHASATGKAMLAASPEATVEQLLAEPLTRLTEHTIVDPDGFRAELARIRQRGYAINLGERRADVGAVAAVIRSADGRPVA